MIRFLQLAALTLAALSLSAQAPPATNTAPPAGSTRTIPLWPDAAPLALRTGPAATNGDIPQLFVYPAATSVPSAHTAVIVLPGGGYTHLVMEGEGAVEARLLAAHGIQAFVLQYRLSPAYRYPAPMLDGARAIRYVRAHAADFGVNPNQIGIWGFSAGGHLAAWLATSAAADNAVATDTLRTTSARPDFAVISYGRMALADPVPRPNPAKTARIEDVLAAPTSTLDIIPRVSSTTSPSFIYSTTGDQTVDSRNATTYYNALKAAAVPAELHVFELGAHGSHIGQDHPQTEHELTVVPTLVLNWLALHHFLPDQP
jgi:acetyl esterase/lipase